jgi:cystathionine gamma-synthase
MTAPLWRKEDLGKPMPDLPHAISVCLPTWDHVVGYEEGRREVVDALSCGYPRFTYHPFYRELCRNFAQAYARPDEYVLALPSEKVAQKCVAFVGAGRVQPTGKDGIALAIVPRADAAQANAFWQHTGQIVSSRWAENILRSRPSQDSAAAKRAVRGLIASLAGSTDEDIYLFNTGMGAIFTAHEIIKAGHGEKIIQLGFPYLDTLKVLQKFGKGALYIPYNSAADLAELKRALDGGGVSAVFCEIPGNPLLHTIDLPALSAILRRCDVPLVIDDTVGTWANIDLKPYADLTVTSLSKFFSGEGNVMGGSLVLNRESPHYGSLKKTISAIYEDLLYPDDAAVLAENGRDFSARMTAINGNAETLAEHLNRHPRIKQVFYPKLVDRAAYDAIRKKDGGYGGLLSFTLKNPADAPAIYDRLEVHKGPSLGAVFTLACPYTLLAHFNELPFADENGIEAALIRISVGVENAGDLISRFDRALTG